LHSYSRLKEADLYDRGSSLVKISSLYRYKNKNYINPMLDIIYEILSTNDGGSDNDDKGSQTPRFQPRF
jgi:hypothetical protein